MAEDRANPEKTSKREQAINLEETHGEKINHQVQDKRQHHEPRDKLNNH